jgi:hypothetical protein
VTFVPICAAVAVIVWNYYRLQRHLAHPRNPGASQ